MGEDNVLTAGLDLLYTMKENLLEMEGWQQKAESLTLEEDKLEKLIQAKEKAMADEINVTIRKRQEEVAFSFDEQIDKTRIRLKKVKTKRDKYKDTKMSERMDMETSELMEERRKLKMDVKSIYKVNQIPRIFNTKLFFSLHMPSEITDFLVFLLSVVVIFTVPFCIFKLSPAEKETTFRLVMYYIITVAAAFGIYVLVHKKVKETHQTALKQVKAIRLKISANRKAIEVVKKSIKKDPDESIYGLDKFDEEMSKLDSDICDIAEEKKAALTIFENQTKKVIAEEIRSGYQADIDKYKQDYEKAYNDHRAAEEKVKDFKLEISMKYEAYVGKEYMTIPMIDSLIDIINTGDALTIADAIKFYEKQIELSMTMQKDNK